MATPTASTPPAPLRAILSSSRITGAAVAKLAYAAGLKSAGDFPRCRFESDQPHHSIRHEQTKQSLQIEAGSPPSYPPTESAHRDAAHHKGQSEVPTPPAPSAPHDRRGIALSRGQPDHARHAAPAPFAARHCKPQFAAVQSATAAPAWAPTLCAGTPPPQPTSRHVSIKVQRPQKMFHLRSLAPHSMSPRSLPSYSQTLLSLRPGRSPGSALPAPAFAPASFSRIPAVQSPQSAMVEGFA
jgi:hypothetical protein